MRGGAHEILKDGLHSKISLLIISILTGICHVIVASGLHNPVVHQSLLCRPCGHELRALSGVQIIPIERERALDEKVPQVLRGVCELVARILQHFQVLDILGLEIHLLVNLITDRAFEVLILAHELELVLS